MGDALSVTLASGAWVSTGAKRVGAGVVAAGKVAAGALGVAVVVGVIVGVAGAG